MSQRTLIAGMGRLGQDVAGRLLARGHEVVGINRSGRCSLPGPVMLALDLTRPLTRALPEVDNLVVALAPGARDPRQYRDTYVGGVSHLMAALPASVKRLLYVSSTVVYPQDDGSWVNEESPVSPHNLRAQVQLEAEAALQAGARSAGAAALVLRLGGIYGPDRLGLLRRVRSGQAAPGNPMAYSNRITQHDAARLLQHLLDADVPAGSYLGVDHEPALMQDVCAWLAEEMGMAPVAAVKGAVAGKRISNQGVLATGFRFDFPTYREGYRALLPLLENEPGQGD